MDQEHRPEPSQIGHNGAAVDPESVGGRGDVDLASRGRSCPSKKGRKRRLSADVGELEQVAAGDRLYVAVVPIVPQQRIIQPHDLGVAAPAQYLQVLAAFRRLTRVEPDRLVEPPIERTRWTAHEFGLRQRPQAQNPHSPSQRLTDGGHGQKIRRSRQQEATRPRIDIHQLLYRPDHPITAELYLVHREQAVVLSQKRHRVVHSGFPCSVVVQCRVGTAARLGNESRQGCLPRLSRRVMKNESCGFAGWQTTWSERCRLSGEPFVRGFSSPS